MKKFIVFFQRQSKRAQILMAVTGLVMTSACGGMAPAIISPKTNPTPTNTAVAKKGLLNEPQSITDTINPTDTLSPTFTLVPTDTKEILPSASPTDTATMVPTQTETLAPSPTITPTEIPTLTAVPQPTSTSPQNGFTLTYLSSPVNVGEYASAKIKTTPGISCTIKYVTSKGTTSTAKGLEPVQSDSNGICSWRWRIGTGTAPGEGTVTITADGVTQSFPIVIQ